jgi:hypothetical protein
MTPNPNQQAEREAFEAWYETAACLGVEPTWAAWQARAALSQAPVAVPEGYALVPVEPTLEMLTAASLEDDKAFVDGSCHGAARGDLWAAMLSAATTPQPAAEPSDAELQVHIYEHTKLNINQAADVELVGYIVKAMRAALAKFGGKQ